MAEICGDNRFELINKYKRELIEATNIETAPDEMAVLDDILFRFWQMGWLDKLEQPETHVSKLSPEQWGLLTDVDFDHIDRIWFHTKHDKDVVFVKERKGKWIKDKFGTVICSECKAQRRDNRIDHIRFCNACGADMRGKRDEEGCYTVQERF